ncbi:GNAT family N-acetyltransferase [Roseobacter sinensis]|uniref:GNAT family N-acetyltransferase n=1 Tax=Roseobacter sinensis TaxID=2931391 RepID=A0ABT3BFH5_9RHOB|nr:GNAT family N-acetyltransferase [Roseobacter sp. WL0113]MCV3272329.1 GNAT family N-acetyltransferase [Roseobacter sp. WL0113]
MFDSAPQDTPPALQQSAEFARALEEAGTPALQLPDGTLVLRRQFGPLPVSMITRPLTTTASGLAGLARAVPVKGPRLLSPDRPLPLHEIGALPLISPATVAVLDLRPDEETLMGGLHPKWRNRLRHGQAHGLRITRQNMPADPGHWLVQADLVQQAARGYRGWPTPLTLAFGRANPGKSKLFVAHWGSEPVAAMLILRHGRGATYHIGHTRPSGRLMSAHTVLMWSVMLWAKSKGVEFLDLGTINSEDAKGLERFKLGTGARARPLGGTWVWWPPLTTLARPVARIDRRLMGLD